MNDWHISECWVDGHDTPYCDFAQYNFNWGVSEYGMKWRDLEPEYDNLDTWVVDNVLNWVALQNWGYR